MTARTGGTTPAPPPAAQESLQGHYAGFASRLLILAIINFVASIVTGKNINFNRNDIWVVVGYVVWAFIYFAHWWGLNGKTAGGGLFGVQVLTDDGRDVSGRRSHRLGS